MRYNRFFPRWNEENPDLAGEDGVLLRRQHRTTTRLGAAFTAAEAATEQDATEANQTDAEHRDRGGLGHRLWRHAEGRDPE